MMDKDKEKKILILALEKNLIEISDLKISDEDILKGQKISTSSLELYETIKALLAKGKLKEADIVLLEKEIETFEKSTIEFSKEEQKEIKESPKKRYKLIKLIGEGGMGKVYKAHDLKLNRYVALKFLKENDPLKQKRFLNEAQAQAKLKSDVICKIYEVGEMDGKPFISMQYIEGKNLRDAAKEMNLEMKLNIIRKVAEGLQEAHKIGILHRDINPANIMIEKDEKGEPKPYIMDFGLAKEVSEPSVTQEGMIMGTLYYMSPEQSKGLNQKLDRRSDVYSLGATLYEILSSKPPFTGNFIEVLDKIQNQEPEPLRKLDPTIPKDVASITNKCLEKDPNLRYYTAKALAEDLDRFLNGDPVLARRTTFFYYLYKKIKKNKIVYLTTFIAFIIVLAFSLMWLNEKIAYRKKAKIMQKFGEEIKEVESIMRFSHLLPLHNNFKEKKSVFDKIEKIREKMGEIGKIGEGPGNYAIGRAYMSLGDYKNAYNFFQKSLENKYNDPEFFYSYGLVLGKIYQEELKDLERIRNKELREAKRKELEGEYKNKALFYIKEGKKTNKELADYSEILIYFYEKEYEKALKEASKFEDKTSWFYEIYKLKGDIHIEIGREKENIGQLEEAEKEYILAEKEYLKAKEIGRSDISIYIGLADLMRLKFKNYALRGNLNEEIFIIADREIENALKIDPENEKIYNLKSLLYWNWANELFKYGNNPLTFLEEAILSAEKALSLKGDFSSAYNNLGVSYIIKSGFEEQNGIDSLFSIKKSIECYGKAIKLDPKNAEIYINNGNAYAILVDYYLNKGEETLPFIEKAIENFDKALEFYPHLPSLLNNSGIIFQYKAEYEREKGKDPREFLKIAIERQIKAIEKNPNYLSALLNLGVNYAEIALYEAEKGISPEKNLEISNKYYKEALKINPNYAKALNNLGGNYIEISKYKIEIGENPEDYFILAEEALNKTLEIEKISPYPLNDLGELYLQKATYDIKKGKNPEKNFKKSLEFFLKASNIYKSWTTPYYNMAMLHLRYANYKISKKFDPLKDFEKAEEEASKALSINRNYYLYNELIAEILINKAEYFILKNKEFKNFIIEAEKFIEKSIKENPENENIYKLKDRLSKIKSK